MAGKILRYDCYDLRKFKVGDIHTFLDIGANIGTTSLMAQILNPTARVIALEPVKETFEVLRRNLEHVSHPKIECYNIALGDGKPMCFHRRKYNGMHRFYSEKEKELGWWDQHGEYLMDSKTGERHVKPFRKPPHHAQTVPRPAAYPRIFRPGYARREINGGVVYL